MIPLSLRCFAENAQCMDAFIPNPTVAAIHAFLLRERINYLPNEHKNDLPQQVTKHDGSLSNRNLSNAAKRPEVIPKLRAFNPPDPFYRLSAAKAAPRAVWATFPPLFRSL